MKRITYAGTIAALLSALIIGSNPVTADENDELCAQISAAVQQSEGNICVSIRDGVATLSGYVENAMEREAAERAAASSEGITEVVNLIAVSN